MKNKFLRRCVACRNSREKESLIRFVFDGKSFVQDLKGNMDGRGYYVCKDNEECMNKSEKIFSSMSKKKEQNND